MKRCAKTNPRANFANFVPIWVYKNLPSATRPRGYCGDRLRIFKYFNRSIFVEEMQKLDANARLDGVSEKVFVQALQATANRVANWSVCRNQGFPVFAGPQVYPHKDCVVRMHVGCEVVSSSTPAAADCFGWLQCMECSKWRRVTSRAVQMWG